jgi:hypothetical protein
MVLGAFYMSWTARRGWGVGRVPLDEWNGGGTGTTSPPLPSGTGGHPTVVHGSTACRGAAAAANWGGGRVGVA